MNNSTYKRMGLTQALAHIAPNDRAALLNTASALIVAYSLPLPSEKVENPRFYFVENYSANVDAKYNEVNELVSMGGASVYEETVRGIWLTRYKLLHEPLSGFGLDLFAKAASENDYELSPKVRDMFAGECKELKEAIKAVSDYLA